MVRLISFQVIEAARTLAHHPVSKIAQENCTVFIDIWESQVEELGKLLRSIISGGDLRRSKHNHFSPVYISNISLTIFLTTLVARVWNEQVFPDNLYLTIFLFACVYDKK